MAIDDAEKRKSISGILLPLIPGVTPNVSTDREWRQESGWLYSGIVVEEGTGINLIARYWVYLMEEEERPAISFLNKPGHAAFEPKTDIKFEDDNPQVRYRGRK